MSHVHAKVPDGRCVGLHSETLSKITALFQSYNSHVLAVGLKRQKALEWSAQHLQLLSPALLEHVPDEVLLQKVGWSTYIGLGLYAGALAAIEAAPTAQRLPAAPIVTAVTATVHDILRYTDVGCVFSLGVRLEKHPSLRYARMDGAGNICIYPVDTEELYDDIVVACAIRP